MSLYKNKTFLFDANNNTFYIGNYKPSRGLTAHQRLANAHGISHDTQLVGGYFDKSGQMQ